jgi:hypothetical protein
MEKQHRVSFYNKAKASVIGDKCTCAGCGKPFEKIANNQVFCKNQPGTKCKDAYWNNVIETKRNNRTRISPASRAWRDKMSFEGDHPFSSDALGQW